MKQFMTLTVLAIMSTLSYAQSNPTPLTKMLPGYDRFDLTSAHRAWPIAVSIWYPAATTTYPTPIGDGPVMEPTLAFTGAAMAKGRHPLVLLTHGSGGNADTLGWLSSGLVAHGAIVLAVNHPGSTTGDSSPRRAVDLASRANDLRAALDFILTDSSFAIAIDQERVSVVGFSLGGATALGLVGLRFDGKKQAGNCAKTANAADCGFFLRGGVDFANAKGFSDETKDDRISRAVVIDPGFGSAVSLDSLPSVTAPVHFINLVGDGVLPAVDVSPKGNNLAARLAGASYNIIAPANHFTFLGICKAEGQKILSEEGDDPICTDPEDSDRKAIHAQLIADIAKALGL